MYTAGKLVWMLRQNTLTLDYRSLPNPELLPVHALTQSHRKAKAYSAKPVQKPALCRRRILFDACTRRSTSFANCQANCQLDAGSAYVTGTHFPR